MPLPDRRLRILHVIHRLGDGGADRTLTHVVSRGDPEAFAHVILTTGTANGGFRQVLPSTVRVIEPPGDGLNAAELLGCLRAGAARFDLVHGWVSYASIVAALAASVTGRPLILRQPTNVEQELLVQGDYLRRHLVPLREAFQVADLTIVPSPVLVPGTRRVYGAPRIGVIPNAAPFVPDDAPAGGRRQPRFVVAFAGRLVAQKDPLVALDAMLRLQGRLDWELWIFGEGELRRPLEDRLLTEDLRQRVRFAGFRPGWLACRSQIDLFFLPTRFEGLSNTLLEAAAAGLPIVTTDLPENRYVLEPERECVMRAPGDVEGFAEAIARLAAEPAKRRALAERARLASRRFGLQALVSAHEEAYRAVAEGKAFQCAA